MASVVAFDARSRELSETEALDWLRLQPHGHAPASSAVLAERWGWSRQRVARCLRTWQASGLITRVGKNLAVAVRDDDGAVAVGDDDAAARTTLAANPTQKPVQKPLPPVLAAPAVTSTVDPPAPVTPALPAVAIVAP